MTSFEKLSQEKKEHIVTVCMRNFMEKGYNLANTVDMAKLCGIAKGSLFHYFGSKKDLFLYLVRLCSERVMAETRHRLSCIKGESFLDRVRESVMIKMALPAQFPKETAFLAKAFSDINHEAAQELRALATAYTAETKALNRQYIGDLEPELLREDIQPDDARFYVQNLLDSVTTRLLQQYAAKRQELLDNTQIISDELEKAMDFILNGLGKRG